MHSILHLCRTMGESETFMITFILNVSEVEHLLAVRLNQCLAALEIQHKKNWWYTNLNGTASISKPMTMGAEPCLIAIAASERAEKKWFSMWCLPPRLWRSIACAIGGRLLSSLSGVKNVRESNGCGGIIQVATHRVLTPTGLQNVSLDCHFYEEGVS